MFAYLLRVHQAPNEQTTEFFKRFKETPGLAHAYSLQGTDDPQDSVVVSIWESKEAAERYLQASALRQQVDQSVAGVTRTTYNVLDSK